MAIPVLDFDRLDVVSIIRGPDEDQTSIRYRHRGSILTSYATCSVAEHDILAAEFRAYLRSKSPTRTEYHETKTEKPRF